MGHNLRLTFTVGYGYQYHPHHRVGEDERIR